MYILDSIFIILCNYIDACIFDLNILYIKCLIRNNNAICAIGAKLYVNLLPSCTEYIHLRQVNFGNNLIYSGKLKIHLIEEY